ncbi:MAG: ZmpA/ZmpB/ZmpC family metallo-endopeptidase, partial [Streptococcus sp.]|nr:ZmpA/ZmpB/ZmpC family metallo-endopeptidase [Streptococcus sp.]
KVINGKRTDEILHTETVENKAPVTEITTVGTKPIESTEVVTEHESIPFKKETVSDPNRYTDYSEVTTVGQLGERTITKTYKVIKGKRTDEVLHTETVENKAPVTEITTVGTKSIESTEVVTEHESIPFKKETVSDPERYTDYSEVTTAGQLGERTITKTYKVIKGKRTDEVLHTETVESKAPVTEITTVGTKPIESTEVVTEHETIPFTIEKTIDNNAWLGEETVTQVGVDGDKQVTKVYKTVKGIRTNDAPSVTEEITKPAISQKVSVGNKQLDKEILKEQLVLAASKEENNYTSSSWSEFKKALQAAQSINNKQEATHNQQSQEQINEAIETLKTAISNLVTKQEIPTLSVVNVEKKENQKEAIVTYSVANAQNNVSNLVVNLKQGDNIVATKTVDLTKEKNLSSVAVQFDHLNYYTDYSIQAMLDYVANDVAGKADANSDVFNLFYKKIELKDIDQVELYGKDGSNYRRYIGFNSIPSNLNDCFIKVKSDRFKEALLPISQLEETEQGYKATVTVDELVQDNAGQYHDNMSVIIPKTMSSTTAGVYTSFKELVQAISANPSGTFTLGSDMTADELLSDKDSTSYIKTIFTGSLNGENAGKKYTIHHLTKPLFNELNGATVTNLSLKEVAIADRSTQVGALANVAKNTTISAVSVQGDIQGSSTIGGLVGSATNSTLTNTSFDGAITSKQNGQSAFSIGGLVGELAGNKSSISKSGVRAAISTESRNTNQRIGGITGYLNTGAKIEDSTVTGSISAKESFSRIGGVIGSNYVNGGVKNVVSSVDVPNGYSITGDQYSTNLIANSAVIEGTQSKLDRYAKTITKAEAEERIQKMNSSNALTDATSTDKSNGNLFSVNYTNLPNAQKEREIAYENIEKLLPFYNKELIVHYGNKVDSDNKLYKTKLLDVVPMFNDTIITDIASNKTKINRLLFHFADGTVAYQDISYTGDFKNSQVVEYRFVNSDLIYTPEEFVSNYNSVINRVKTELSNVHWNSQEMRTVLGLNDSENPASLDLLFLEDSFSKVKNSLDERLIKLLSMDKSINTTGTSVENYLTQKILDNKVELLLGLSYMNRWYNINYGSINTLDLSTFKSDFSGDTSVSNLDTLIALGKSAYTNLVSKNNVLTYANSLAKSKGKDSIFDYVEYYRQLFLPNKTNNEWFKENTKAYIVESKSNIAEVRNKQEENANLKNQYALGVYEKISNPNWSHKNMLLPLLTMEHKGVYILSNMTTLSFGSYERYRKTGTDTVRTGTDLENYVEEQARKVSDSQRDHFDFWYKILPEDHRNKLFRSVPVYDGFGLVDETGKAYWADLTDKKSSSVSEFFGPIGKWYANNGNGAYANGNLVHFVITALLSDYALSTFTHEMVHNLDSSTYFEGYGRREGQGGEFYARGFLQAPYNLTSPSLTINSIYSGEDSNRLHTNKPAERFNNQQDLKEYVHGMLDVIYTMEYLEAQSVLKQSDANKKKWWKTIENYYVQDSQTGKDTHAGNSFRELSDEQVAKLKDFNSLIDNNIVNKREYGYGNKQDDGSFKMDRNGYYLISQMSSVYAALDNPNGGPGDFMFRRMAYELLADKGYDEGFLPYASNKLKDLALANGKTITSGNSQVGLVTDDLVLKTVYSGKYASWSDFKKAMYQERIAKLANLKPITIVYELGNLNTEKRVTISDVAQLQSLMDAAVALDVKNGAQDNVRTSWVNVLRKKVYGAYLQETNDFKQSIFN